MGRLINEAKAEFLKDQQEELEDDPNKFWRLVKSIVPGKKRKSGNISLVDRGSLKNLTKSKEKPLSYILQKSALKYLNVNQNDSSRPEKVIKQ